jgi:hypothetical protein
MTEYSWEVDTMPTELVQALDEPLEDYKPKRVPKPKPGKNTHHVLSDGENIQTVAAMYLPADMARKEYAKELHRNNKRWVTGALIKL